MIEQLQNAARDLLENKKADVVIGYATGFFEKSTTPVFLTDPGRVSQLVWNSSCLNNLSVYLKRDEVKRLGKPAIVAKGCDIKTIIGLIQENQVKREDIVIIGVECQKQLSHDMAETGEMTAAVLSKCLTCDVHSPKMVDILIKDPDLKSADAVDPNPIELKIDELEGKSAEERWQFWEDQLSKCVKCYACRQACPLCYCSRCIVDKTTPQWMNSASDEVGNFTWNIIRSYHLAGRCVGCGECERVCPMNIPLSIINRKIAREIEKEFGYRAGEDEKANPALSEFTQEDNNSFIR